MQDITHSSKKIAEIIGVIEGIAFQTNILALNAAVEAARSEGRLRASGRPHDRKRPAPGRCAQSAFSGALNT